MTCTSCNYCFGKSGLVRMVKATWALLRGGLKFTEEHQGLHLWLHPSDLNIFAEPSEVSHMLTIEAHVLGMGLAETNINALFSEVVHNPGSLVIITTDKTLVGHVKELERFFFHCYCCCLLLLRMRVHSHGIVGRSVQKNSLLWCFWNILPSACEVKATSLGVIVLITLQLRASVSDGLGRRTSWLNLKNLCRSLALIPKASVPEMVCTVTYWPIFNTLLFSPRVNFIGALQNSASPARGRFSLFRYFAAN